MLEAFLISTMSMATPIMLAALGELIVEESGIINVGIEGPMLAGAFFALVAPYFSGSLPLGLGAGVFAAVGIDSIFAMLVETFSAARGFVARSVVIPGRWNAWGLGAGSLLFGAAVAVQFGLQALGTVVP